MPSARSHNDTDAQIIQECIQARFAVISLSVQSSSLNRHLNKLEIQCMATVPLL